MRRIHLFLGVLLLLISCGKVPSNEVHLTIKWEGNESDSTALFVALSDSLGLERFDTVQILNDEGKKRLKLKLSTPMKGFIYPADKRWQLPIQLQNGQQITASIDYIAPHLNRIEGYPEADLRSEFIYQNQKQLRLLDQLLSAQKSQATALSAKELRKEVERINTLYKELRTEAAHFIVKNKEKEGINRLAEEYFSGFEGAAAFHRLYPLEALPNTLIRLRNHIEHWNKLSQEKIVSIRNQLPIDEKLRDKLPNTYDTIQSYIIWALSDTTLSKRDSLLLCRTLDKDSVERRLFVLTLSLHDSSYMECNASDKAPQRAIDTLHYADRWHSLHAPTSYILQKMNQWGIDTLPYYVAVDEKSTLLYRGNRLPVALDSVAKKQKSSAK